KTHLALPDIENLRQLVDARIANEATDPSYAAIVLLCPFRLAILFRVGPHAAKFMYPKHLATVSNALLAVDQRRLQPFLQLDGYGGQQHERPRHQQQYGAGYNIEKTL